MTLTSVTSELLQKLGTNSTKDAKDEGLKILLKLLDNVINDPSNDKYRRFRVENKIIKEKLLSLNQMSLLLQNIGFIESEGSYVLPSNVLIAKLKEHKILIEQVLQDNANEKQETSCKETVCANANSDNQEKGAIKKQTTSQKYPRPLIKSRKTFVERTTFPQTVNINNQFLKQLESLSDMVMQYEDETLKECGRALIPYEKLKLQAIEHLRCIQKEIKAGKCNSPEPILNDLMLYELVEWFKNDFFTWVNHAPCTVCGKEDTRAFGQSVENGVRVEEYFCCNRVIKFYRYNDITKLLQTRRGRCGEWANCFTFLCRCLGYNARYIYSTEDHVWTEIYSDFQKKWIHVDPSDNVVDAPLMYEYGWKKDIKYVIAFSHEDVQDVTWRYSNKHTELLKKRNLCEEKDLLKTITELRKKRQQGFSEKYLIYLKKRTLRELVELLVERQPTDDEKRGRSSGSLAWRQARMEANTTSFYVFEPNEEEIKSKQFNIRYSCAKDKYERYLKSASGQVFQIINSLEGWNVAVYHSDKIFKKYEPDWKMVYLARLECAETASIMWRFDFSEKHLKIKNIQLRFDIKTYESGKIDVFFLDKNGLQIKDMKKLQGESKFSIKAVLSGGNGDCAWQHTQLFRQEKGSSEFPFILNVLFE